MFEKLLETILSNVIGEYVEGISKDQIKVGILGGNVEIQNLIIKKNIVQQFNLPFDLKFGMVEHIKLKIPWTSIQSSPVMVYLKGLYILVVPKDKSTWGDIQKNTILAKHQLLISFAETLRATITEKLKIQDSKTQEGGYVSNLIQKIVDNLQIDIKDIHIRLESNDKMENLSLGITLDKLNVFTCDKNWEPKFLDGKPEKVYKKLLIQNFFIYFNSKETLFLQNKCQSSSDYLESLRELIYDDNKKETTQIQSLEYLLNFSTTGKLVQTKLTNEVVHKMIPQYDILISLDQTNFSLSKNQIKQFQQVVNIAVEYRMFETKNNKKYEYYGFRPTRMIADQKKEIIKSVTIKEWWRFALKYAKGQVNQKDQKWMLLTKERKVNLKDRFLTQYEELLKTPTKSNFAIFSNEDMRFYENVLMTLNSTMISKWIEEKVKQEKIDEQLEEEKKKKQGYFGGWFKQSKELDDEEKLEIEAYVQELIEAEQEQEIELTNNYPKIKFTLIQNKFQINLVKKELFDQGEQQILISTKTLKMDFYMQKLGFVMDMGLNNFKIKYQELGAQKNELFSQQILNCKELEEKTDQKQFMKVRIEDHPLDQPGLDKDIEVSLGSIDFIYNRKMIQCATDIFTFDTVNDDLTDHLKTTAQMKIRQAQDISHQAMSNFIDDQPKFIVKVSMSTPQIILPIDQENIRKSACWVFHPGNLQINGDTFTQKEDKVEKMYDKYSISLEKISMMYCKNIQELFVEKKVQVDNQQDELFYTVFKDFNIGIDAKIMKQVFVQLNLKEERTIVNANLNELNMNFNGNIIRNLKEIANIFVDERVNSLESQKNKLISDSQINGFLYLTVNQIKTPYYGVLNKNTLIFYQNPEIDMKPFSTIDLNISEFEFINGTFQIHVKNKLQKSEQLMMEFDSLPTFDRWKEKLIQRIDQIRERNEFFSFENKDMQRTTALTMNDSKQSGQEPVEEIDEEITTLLLNFNFENFMVNISTQKVHYTLCSSNMNLQHKQTTIQMSSIIELTNFTLQTNESGTNEYLISSNYEQSIVSQIFKNNFIQDQKKLIIIKHEQKKVDGKPQQNAEILFGSMFLDLDTNKLRNLMSVVMASGKSSNSQSQIQRQQIEISEDALLNPKTLEIYNRAENKFWHPEQEPIDMLVSLKIEAINVLVINEMKGIPMNNLIVKDSLISVKMRKGMIDIDAKFNDMNVFDLTNYPFTLTEKNLSLIKPRKMFGMLKENSTNTLVHAQIKMKDPLYCNIEDDFVTGEMNVLIQDINIDFHMQVVFRLLGFLTEQLLPALIPPQDTVKQQKFGTVSKKQAFINIFKPFWPRMNIQIKNTQCNFDLQSNKKVMAYLTELKIENERSLCEDRLLNFNHKHENKYLNLIKGIWNDEYTLTFSDLNCVLIEAEGAPQKLTSGLNMTMIVQMALFEQEYKALFGAKKVSNHNQKYIKTQVVDTFIKELNPDQFYFDNTISVDFNFSSFIAMIGNREYAALMGVLEKCVSKNDGNDSIYIKDFQKKQEIAEPLSLYVNIGMSHIAFVSLDNKNENRVFSKIFLTNLGIQFASYQSGQMIVQIGIDELKGSHLLKNGVRYYEKGFIGDFTLIDVFEPKDNEDLKNLFIRELLADDGKMSQIRKQTMKVQPSFSLLMEDDKERNIQMTVQNLKVLAQLDVLLHLSSITALENQPPNEQSPTQDLQAQTQQVEQKAPQKQLRMNVHLIIKNNFFLLTDAKYDNCMVLKGDININVTLCPESLLDKKIMTVENYQSAQEQIKISSVRDITKSALVPTNIDSIDIQQLQSMRIIRRPKPAMQQKSEIISKDGPSLDASEQYGIKQMIEMKEQAIQEWSAESSKLMSVDLKLQKIQFFLTKFIDVIEDDIENIPKREILLPWTLELKLEKYLLFIESKEFKLPTKMNIQMVQALIQQIELKVADDDAEILVSIMNHAMVLMDAQKPKGNEKTAEVKKQQTQENEELREEMIEQKQNLPVKTQDEKTSTFISFNILNYIKITLVHKFEKMFVPNFIFQLKSFKIAADIEENIKALVAFGINFDYFNSDIFKWEPFIESTNMKFEYETITDENDIKGQNIRILNPSKKFNINFTIPFIKKILFLQNTSSKLQEKQQEELKNLSEDILVQNLEKLRSPSQLKNSNGQSELKNRVFVSPVNVSNNTGYDLEITYYKKLVLISQNNVPQMKNMYNQSIFVKNGESTPLSIEEDDLDQNDEEEEENNEEFTQTFSYKFLSFRITHPIINIKKVSGLNLEQNFSKKIVLDGDQKHVRHLNVLFNSQNENELKHINITSPIMIENFLKKQVDIQIKQADTLHNFSISPGQKEYIKFDLLFFLTFFKINDQDFNFRHKKLDHFVGKQTGYYHIMSNKDKSYNFVMKVIRSEEFPQLIKIALLPGFGFKNLLPVPIKLKVINQNGERCFEMFKHQQIQISDFDISVKVSFKVQIQGFKESKEQILIQNQKLDYDKQIELEDQFGCKNHFNIVRLKKEYRHFDFAIYSEIILINETHLCYKAQNKNVKEKKTFKNVAGQYSLKNEEDTFDKQIMFVGSDNTEIKLQLENDKIFYCNEASNSIIVQGIGSGVIHQNLFMREDTSKKSYFLEVGYKNYVYNVDEEEYIASKVIQLIPKTILYNKTKLNIKLLNQSQLHDSVLKPEEKQPLYIYDVQDKKNKFMDFQIEIEDTRYKNFFPLNLNTAGSSLFGILNMKQEMKIIRVETIIQDDYVVVNFIDRNGMNDLLLKNKSDFTLKVHQKNCKEFWIGVIPPRSQIEVGFINPYKDNCYVFKFYNEMDQLVNTIEFDINNIDNKPEYKTYFDQQIVFRQQLIINDKSRILEISCEFKEIEERNKKMTKFGEPLNDLSKSNFINLRLDIKDIGISVIAGFNSVTTEIFYIYMNNITLIAIMTEKQREIQFVINYLNIDNNYYALSKYPIFMTSSSSLQQIEKTGEKFLNFHCVQNVIDSENLLSFDVIEFQIMPLVLSTEDYLAEVGMQLGEQFGKVMNSKNKRHYIEKYFIEQEVDSQSLLFFKKNSEWEILPFKTSHTWFYCKELQIAQLQIILSVGINQLSEFKLNSNKNVNNLMKTIGITFISIDESPLYFPNLALYSLFESFEGFQNIMITHYKDTMSVNIAKILGNLDIMGNPVSLFSNIAGGFKAVYEKPKEGFVKGPLEGFVGIGKGGATLFQATTTSAFKAVSKMSNSIASGLTSLAMDEKYLRERNLHRARKPQNVFEGVGKGFYSIGKGVFSGITGVFTKPIDEMNKSGAHGFFKGMMKGVGGLITKPIGGVFDAVSLTAEGSKKTFTWFGDKANESKHRIPRVFYGDQRFVKKYNSEDAKIMRALFFIEQKKFENDIFLDSIEIPIDEIRGQFFYFVLSQEHLILLKEDFKKVVLYCEIKDIIRVIIQDKECLSIQYQQNNESKNFKINGTENKVNKILKSTNYARYLYYTKMNLN